MQELTPPRVLYMTNSIDQTGGGQFVFSNGDTTGYGFHGDFVNGWDQTVQTEAVQDCLYTDNGGVISACSSLVPSDDVNFPRDCPEQPSVYNEPVHGTLSALPGCNPITSGPDPAPQIICPLNSNALGTSDSSSLSGATSTSNLSPSLGTATTTLTFDPTLTSFSTSVSSTTDAGTIAIPASTSDPSQPASFVTVTLFPSPQSTIASDLSGGDTVTVTLDGSASTTFNGLSPASVTSPFSQPPTTFITIASTFPSIFADGPPRPTHPHWM